MKKGKRCWPRYWGRKTYSDNSKATQTMTKCFGNTKGGGGLILIEEIGKPSWKELVFEHTTKCGRLEWMEVSRENSPSM